MRLGSPVPSLFRPLMLEPEVGHQNVGTLEKQQHPQYPPKEFSCVPDEVVTPASAPTVGDLKAFQAFLAHIVETQDIKMMVTQTL